MSLIYMNYRRFLCVGLILSQFSFSFVWAQASNADDVNDQEIEKSVDLISDQLEKNFQLQKEYVNEEDENLSGDLKEKDIAPKANYNNIRSNEFNQSLGVVQKNRLEKTNTVQYFGGLTLVPTEVYYRTFGGQAGAHYHLNEKYGVGLLGYFFSSSARGEINQLEKTQSVDVKNLVYLKSYYAAQFYLNTIYGKVAYFNQSIIPFETYFNFGAGRVTTQSSSEAVGLHVGLGNLFTISPKTGLKVDLNWLFYRTKNINNQEQDANSILLSVSYAGFYKLGAETGSEK